MKILVHDWKHYIVEAVDDVLSANNISYDKFSYTFEQDKYDEEFLTWFETEVDASQYDFVLSINYQPMIALACYKQNCRYVSWCYDCPFNITHPEDTLGLPTNYCFVFDYKQYLGYKNRGIDTVYHLPLGANAKKVRNFKYDRVMSQKYASDISFVGVLYESQLPIILSLLNDQTKEIIFELVKNQEQLYNYNLYAECISNELIDYMNSQYETQLVGTANEFSVNKKALEFALSCEATRRNRIMLLNLFAKRYDTRLYSYQTFDMLNNVKQCGPVDYAKEMPYVFNNSKINLCPCLRCIETGVPLRAFDIMGYGGFLMANYQQELDDMFANGKEIVLYDSYEDALEKADFYLGHEDIRANIAKAGCKKTLENYTLQNAFDVILKTVG